MRLLRHCMLIAIAIVLVLPAGVADPGVTVAQIEPPSIRITKKFCDNASFPVFVESHCYDDDSASFQIESPSLQHATTLQSGHQFYPTVDQFAQGDMWRIAYSSESDYAPVTVLSCLQHRPGEDLMLGVAPAGNSRGLPRWDVWWPPADTGDGERYAPSLECIWFELPNVAENPCGPQPAGVYQQWALLVLDGCGIHGPW